MIFIIGGRFSGKSNYVHKIYNVSEKTVIDGEKAELDKLKIYNVIFNIDILIKKHIHIEGLDKLILNNLRADIITGNEIGCGVVPLDCNDRQWRDITGRIYCSLANKSDTVIRIIAGLPQTIKGGVKWE